MQGTNAGSALGAAGGGGLHRLVHTPVRQMQPGGAMLPQPGQRQVLQQQQTPSSTAPHLQHAVYPLQQTQQVHSYETSFILF